MSTTIDAIYDGVVLRPETALALPPNTKVRVTVEVLAPEGASQRSFLRTARELNLAGPPDWSQNLEHYLYGGDDRAAE